MRMPTCGRSQQKVRRPLRIEGSVSGAEIDDLNADGSPEGYVTSAGSGSYGSLVAYAANHRKSLSEIVLPPLSEAAAKGYLGHDEFAVFEGTLGRRFPIYRAPKPPAACASCSTHPYPARQAGSSGLLERASFKTMRKSRIDL